MVNMVNILLEGTIKMDLNLKSDSSPQKSKYTFFFSSSRCLSARCRVLVFFPEITSELLKIIHRLCCEQFHVGTIFSPASACRRKHLLRDDKLTKVAHVKAQERWPTLMFTSPTLQARGKISYFYLCRNHRFIMIYSISLCFHQLAEDEEFKISYINDVWLNDVLFKTIYSTVNFLFMIMWHKSVWCTS